MSIRFPWLALVAVIPVAAITVAACGGLEVREEPGADAGHTDATVPAPGDAGADRAIPQGDAGPTDSAGLTDGAATNGDAARSPPVDAAAGPTPTLSLLVADPNAYPIGITTDNQVIYTDPSVTLDAYGPVYAVPLDGSAPPGLLAQSSYAVGISGQSVFLWDDAGRLSAWSKNHGLRFLASTVHATESDLVATAAGSSDGAWIAYFTDSTIVVEASDGSSSTIVDSTIVPEFGAVLQFAGDTLVAQFVAPSNAPYAGDAVSSATLAAFAPPSFVETILAAQVQWTGVGLPPWTVDNAGTDVWAPLANPPQNGELIALASPETPTVVDTGAGMGAFSAQGNALYYATTSGALKRIATSAPTSPVTVAGADADAGARLILDVTPDGQYAAFGTCPDGLCDLYIASAAAPGAPVTVDGVREVAVGNWTDPGPGLFTRDSQFLVYSTVNSSGLGLAIQFLPVSGGAPTVLSTSSVVFAQPMFGSVVLVADALSAAGTIDLTFYDLRAPSQKTTFATQASLNWVIVSPDGKSVVYGSPTAEGGIGPGLVRATLP